MLPRVCQSHVKSWSLPVLFFPILGVSWPSGETEGDRGKATLQPAGMADASLVVGKRGAGAERGEGEEERGAKRARAGAFADEDAGCCVICLDSSPPPIQSGCACRGDAGLAHVACRVKAAEAQAPEKEGCVWWQCQTCKQAFTGAMQRGLAEARWAKVRGREQEDGEWQMAALLMARALGDQGRYGEAEQMYRKVLAVERRELGAEDADTLSTVIELAGTLLQQGKLAEAETMYAEVLASQLRAGLWLPASQFELVHAESTPTVAGCDDSDMDASDEDDINDDALATSSKLANCLRAQGKLVEAEEMLRDVLALQRTRRAEGRDTLITAGFLAKCLSDKGRHAAAEQMQRELLAVQNWVLGTEHPSTLITAGDLAGSLSCRGRHAEAEKMYQAVLAMQERVIGADHHRSLETASKLADCFADQKKYAAAVKMQRGLLASQQRVLGAWHPDTLLTAGNLELNAALLKLQESMQPHPSRHKTGRSGW